MNTVLEELVRICESLPEDKRNAVADFARFLAAEQDDARWEQLLDYPGRRPRLETFLHETAAEGETPLDLDRL